jgi:predicted ester cyclase
MNLGFLSAFPDWRGQILDLFAEGDRVVNRWTGQGTHTMPLMGIPPTGKHVTLEGITIFRVENGKVVEEWSQADQLVLMRQLGVVP